MRCTTDAGVVVAHNLLAAPGRFVFIECKHRWREADEVFFHLALILTGGRHNRRLRDEPRRVGLVAMIKDAARSLGDPGTFAGFRLPTR